MRYSESCLIVRMSPVGVSGLKPFFSPPMDNTGQQSTPIPSLAQSRWTSRSERPMPERTGVFPAVRRHDLAAAPEQVFVRDEPVEAHGAACMDTARRDSDLRSEAVAEAVGEARGGVVEDAGRVHAREERLGCGLVGGDDGLGVVRAIAVHVLHGRVE